MALPLLFRSSRPPRCSGFVLPLALSGSALLLLSSLSLQTLAMHQLQRSRHRLERVSRADAFLSAAMQFSQRSGAAQACLLQWPSQQWDQPLLCPGADPHLLQAGSAEGLQWSLEAWHPQGDRGQLTLRLPQRGVATFPLAITAAGAQLQEAV